MKYILKVFAISFVIWSLSILSIATIFHCSVTNTVGHKVASQLPLPDGTKSLINPELANEIIPVEEFYSSGATKVKGQNKGGQADGMWFQYHENGEIQTQGQMLNGKKHGLWNVYHTNGKLKETCEYAEDKKQGLFSQWNIDGNKSYDQFYENGVREGTYIEYYSDGSKKYVGNYVEGKKHGLWILVNEKGKMKQEFEYRADKMAYFNQYDENGKKIDIVTNEADGRKVWWKPYKELK